MKTQQVILLFFGLISCPLFSQSDTQPNQVGSSVYAQPTSLIDSLVNLSSSWTNENGQEFFFFKRTEFESLTTSIKANLALGEQSALKTEELQQNLKIAQDSITLLHQQLDAIDNKQVEQITFFGQDSSKSTLTFISYGLLAAIFLMICYVFYSNKIKQQQLQRLQDAKKQVEVDFEQYKKWALDKEKELTQQLFKEKRKKKS